MVPSRGSPPAAPGARSSLRSSKTPQMRISGDSAASVSISALASSPAPTMTARRSQQALHQ